MRDGRDSVDPGLGGYRALGPVWQAFPRFRVRRCPIAIRPSGALLPKLRLAGGGQPDECRNCLTGGTLAVAWVKARRE